MDTPNFLARIVPVAGNYLTITWTSKDRGWSARSYPAATGQADAANFGIWLASRGADVYFAHAAFTAGEVRKDRSGKEYIHAKREQNNAQLLRVLVIDADVARPGDGKDPAKVFADRRAAATWLLDFMAATGMPSPNMIVNSGYGNHWYWILEDALTPPTWQPLANAMRSAMVANGWVGDTSVTIDSARILRLPGTVNMKSGTPVPVEIYSGSLKADYPNQQIADALAPWMTVQAQATGTHGPATIHQLGPRPTHMPPGQGAGLNQAAHQGIPRRDYSFKTIAAKCSQVSNSLAVHGNGDSRDLWYTGHLTLTEFCADGEAYAHEIGNGDPRYTQAGTDQAIAQIKSEIATKGLGAPRCSSYDGWRHNVCPGCAWFGKLNSPLSLGSNDSDLPDNYRRMYAGTQAACIERYDVYAEKPEWKFMLHGDVKDPRVDKLPIGGHQITFTYEWGGDEFPISGKDYEMTHAPTIVERLGKQGISLYHNTATHVGRFLVAWINQLRAQHAQRQDTLKPFGWNFGAHGKRIGFAMAGDHYRNDGTLEHIPGGDAKIASMYRPAGDYALWRAAAALFEHGRVDLQALIATSFASPLIGLCGDVKGMSMNFWSTESGIGKTSAIRLGQSVWGDPRAMSSMTDTPNAVMKSLSELRTLTRFWDELRVVQSWQEKFTEMIYVIPQGRERARMQSDTSLREVGEWECFLTFTANRSMADLLVINNDGTDSGLQRLFELQMLKIQTAYDPSVGPLIKHLETNYGHAGRVYAKYLGEHPAEVETRLLEVMRAINQDLTMQQEERFFVCSMGCIIVGAEIARDLKIFDFEVRKIYHVLKYAFLAMRSNRVARTLVSNTGGFDLEELVGRYVVDNADWRVRTVSFAAKGAGTVRVTAIPRGQSVKLQIAEAPGVLRIARNNFSLWLHEHNLPASTVIDQLVRDLGAKQHRQTLAGGTRYSAGQIWCIDIPLIGYWPSISTLMMTVMILAGMPLRPAAQAGGRMVLGQEREQRHDETHRQPAT